MSFGNWAWKRPVSTRVALRKGEQEYARWRRELAERAAAQRQQAPAARSRR